MNELKNPSGYLRKALQQHVRLLKEEVERYKRNLWESQQLEDEVIRLKVILDTTFDNPAGHKHTCKRNGASSCKECRKEDSHKAKWLT